jgi:hypothetical protein
MNLLKNVGMYVVVPFMLIVGLALVGQFVIGTPAPVAAIAETGETWWNPISWALDESAAHATQQANAAQANSISYSQVLFILGAGVSALVAIGLIAGVQRGHIAKAETKAETKAKTKAEDNVRTPDPAQKPYVITEGNVSVEVATADERDAVLAGEPARKAGKK